MSMRHSSGGLPTVPRSVGGRFLLTPPGDPPAVPLGRTACRAATGTPDRGERRPATGGNSGTRPGEPPAPPGLHPFGPRRIGDRRRRVTGEAPASLVTLPLPSRPRVRSKGWV